MDSPNGNVDEAQEKLFGEANSAGSKIEIKFVTDSKNGDTKIDISEVRQVFVGMGKEELMEFANNPFWVRMRWFLFISFWTIWFGMLCGAIAIILLAPKCAAPTTALSPDQNPIYHLDLKNFKDSNDDGKGDLPGLESKLDYFLDLGVDTILLDPLMQTADGTDDVIDFKSINPAYGTFEDFKKLIASAKQKGLHLLMKLVPNYSSVQHEWFNKSVAGEEPFKDYYIWTDPVFDKDVKGPRNNWVSLKGGSAWTYNEKRNQYYLHQFGEHQPDLNFRNENVKNYFKEVLKFWLDLGLSGLYLNEVEYLVEDKEFLDEKPSGGKPGTFQDDYDFYTHSHTYSLSETWDIVSSWSHIFKNHSALLIIKGETNLEAGANIISQPIIVDKYIKPYDLMVILNKSTSAFEFTCGDCEERVRVGLQLMLLMLPNATILPSGVELGLPSESILQWESNVENYGFTKSKPWKPFALGFENNTLTLQKKNNHTYFNIFKKILHDRKDASIMQGMTDLKLLNSTITFTRSKIGSPHYLVIFNLENSSRAVDLQSYFGDDLVKLTPVVRIGYNQSEIDVTSASEDRMMLNVPEHSFAIYKFIADAK